MKAAVATDLIDVHALRVGMFVHLDLGWMSHPFPLSNFRITSPAQLATIRSLGIDRVRWSPTESEPMPLDRTGHAALSTHRDHRDQAEPDAANDPSGVETNPAALSRGDSQPEADGDLAAAGADEAAAEAEADGPAVSPEEHARAERKRRLEAQHRALELCQKQYLEAARACRQTFDMVPSRPNDAKAQAEALTRALVDKMIGASDLSIRVLVEGAGDKASMHAMNVGVIALLMGRCFGFGADDLLDLGVGAMLHDVGKIDLPQRLRSNDDTFSPNEMRVYQEHVALGVAQAKRMGLTAGATAVIAQHHEHADASGFPAGLNSDRMTMAARIVALVNRYDNLSNARLPARALTPHESLSMLFAQGRSKYDTSILGVFIKMMGVYPPGSTVQLTDDRYATVVSVNASRPLKPCVLVHDPKVPREEALWLDLETAFGLGIRRSLKPQALPPAALDYLAPTPRVSYFFEAAARPEGRA